MNKMETPNNISEVIKRRRNKVAIKAGYMSLLLRIILLAIAGYLIFTQVFILSRAVGNGMFPAIKDGDLIIGFRLQKKFEKDDVITYKVNGERKVGRFIGRESDVITIDEAGTLLVNGTVQSGEIMYPTYPLEVLEYPYRIPEGHAFVLGDYRTQTEDSRTLGAIKNEDIEGKVITILRRRGL